MTPVAPQDYPVRMPRPVHFEIPATDPQALQDFYSTVFGWTFQKWGDMDYWTITTGDEPDGINGGLYPRTAPAAPGSGVNLVIGVDNAQTYYDRSMAAGATQTMPITPMPGVGILAAFTDPDGNAYGIIEPGM